MKQTVVGLFDKSSDAQQAVEQLLSSGFSNDNVDISSGAINAGTNANSTSNSNDHEGGIGKFFKNLFGDNDADRYTKVASRSNSIVTVMAQSDDEAERAADILDENGAVNVDEKANEYGYGQTQKVTDTSDNYNTKSDAGDYKFNNDAENVNKAIPIIEENLEVGKRTIQTGGVRLRSRIVERPVEENLRLREEYVRVERNTVDRAATDADFNAFKEGEIEMKEHAEVPVISKQARVVEEVSLGKDVNERNETISDTVRKTEVDVEDIEDSKTTSARNRKSRNN